ncbi:MAG TPA: hypothetical protein VKZ53_13130 [Candidatus Angelobacter sp.]|nr:hypothetical protein [Candidatus Angelobacter sp.]
MITVSQDHDGVRMAAVELFEQQLHSQDADRALANASISGEIDDALLAKLCPNSNLSPGYRDFVVYMLWLKSMMHAGVQFHLTDGEAEGLRAIEAARQEFVGKHPPCRYCGAFQYSTVSMRCHKCRKELR